ncbi:MAG: M48 family metallopeptidase [Gammaproteobacteria bacterium]
MEYSNPEIPEGINYSKTHPLKEFAILTTGVFGVLFIALMVIALLADHFAQYIPFRVEKNYHILVPAQNDAPPALQEYLDGLAKRISRAEALPPGMTITVHYVDSDIVNAYATLGGHIVLYRGLLEKLKHENALVMVMAHEIAHVKYRHVIRSMGSGVAVGIALSMLDSSMGDEVVNEVIGGTGRVGMLKFSRAHESQADDTALQAVQKIYGGVNGAEELFEAIKASEKLDFVPVFMRTHPGTDARIRHIQELERKLPSVKLTALPVQFRRWLGSEPASSSPDVTD